jgi:hypothetical protein
MTARQPTPLRETNSKTGRLEDNAIASELRRGARAEHDRTVNVSDARTLRERVAEARNRTLEGAAEFRQAVKLLNLCETSDEPLREIVLAISNLEEKLLWWCHWYSLPIERSHPPTPAAERAVERLMAEKGTSCNAACNAVATYLFAEGLYDSAFIDPIEARSRLAAALRKQSEHARPRSPKARLRRRLAEMNTTRVGESKMPAPE